MLPHYKSIRILIYSIDENLYDLHVSRNAIIKTLPSHTEDPSLISQVFTKLTIKITHSYGIIPYARQAVDRIDPRLCPCQTLKGLTLTVKKQ